MPNGLFGNGSAGHVADARAFMDSNVPAYVGRLMAMGCLVSMGTTRDRGAVSITVTHDGQWEREYFRRSDEAADWLERAIKVLTGLGLVETPTEATGGQRPRRGVRTPRTAP